MKALFFFFPLPMKHLLSLSLVVLLAAFLACSSRQETPVNSMLSTAIAIEDTNAVLALDIYEEAVDQLAGSPDSSLLSETYFRIGILFMRWGLQEECIEVMTAAYRIDSVRCDTFKMYKSLRSIALAYESRGLLTKALYITKQIEGSIDDRVSRRLTMDSFSDSLRYNRMLTMQRELPPDYINELNHLTPKSNELEQAYAGWQAELNGDDEEAIRLYKSLNFARSHYVKAFAQLHLARIYMNRNRQADATFALNLFIETYEQMRASEQTSRELIQHHARYQDRRSKQEISRLSKLSRQQWQLIILVLIIFVLTTVMLLLSLQSYRQRQLILRFRVDKLRQWREEYLQRNESERTLTTDHIYRSAIYQLLQQKLSGADRSPMNSDGWEALHQCVISQYPLFRQRLFQLSRVSDHEYHVCLLLKLGFKPSDIARLTIRSDEAISSTRRRLYQRAFGKKGSPSAWDELIQTL